MDAAIGRIVPRLEKRGQLKNTVIFFTSDNGGQKNYESKTEYGGKHGPNPVLGNNLPWRGWKGELYEGGIRVPAFVYWQGKFKPHIVDQTVSYLDWFPTMAAIAGAKIENDRKLDGRDIGPWLRGDNGNVPATTLYWNTGPYHGIMDGDWKLIVPQRKGKGEIEMFDLKKDPLKKTNLAAEQPKRLEEMKKLLAEQEKLGSRRR